MSTKLARAESKHQQTLNRAWEKVLRLGDRLAKNRKEADLIVEQIIEAVRVCKGLESKPLSLSIGHRELRIKVRHFKRWTKRES